MKVKCCFLLLMVVVFLSCRLGWAEGRYNKRFTIATLYSVSAIDPYADTLMGSRALSNHIFDSLFRIDRLGQLERILVEAVQIESPKQWLFTLKKGVKFHDGHEMTALDVVASLQYAASMPRQEDIYRQIKVSALDRYRFRITTDQVIPTLPQSLINSFIIPHASLHAGTTDFNKGTVIGSGPYRLVAHDGLDQFDLEAFPDYHRNQPYLQHVSIRTDMTPEQRLNGFMSGDVDLIDMLSMEDVLKIKNNHEANFIAPPGYTLYMLSPDVFNDRSPFILDNQGQPMNHNPLKDLRVRQAISKAIDRQALINRFFGDVAKPTAQLQTEGWAGYSLRLQPDKQDLVRARQLLAEAGYPDGFQIILHDKDGRAGMLDAVAGMLRQAGIQASAQPVSADVFFDNLYAHTYSLSESAYAQDGDLGRMLSGLVSTHGAYNYGRYSDPAIDKLIDEAGVEYNETLRVRKFRYINEKVMPDLPVIPLFFSGEIWATHSDMLFVASGDQYTEAYYVKPASSNASDQK